MTAAFKCHDWLCGQEDCARCHPENFPSEQDYLDDDDYEDFLELEFPE